MPKRRKSRVKKSRAKKVRKAVKRKKRTKMTPKKKAGAFNHKAYWKAFKELQEKAEKAWKRLQSDMKKRVDHATKVRHRNELLLLLGECNYMAKECARLEKEKKKMRR